MHDELEDLRAAVDHDVPVSDVERAHLHQQPNAGQSQIGGNALAALMASRPVTAPTSAARLLLEPGEIGEAHQLPLDELFSRLRPAVIDACNRELARVHRSSSDCPYIGVWLAFYQAQSAQHVERAIRRYTGTAATSAPELVDLVVKTAIAAVRRWIDTGQVTGIPGGIEPTSAAAAEPRDVLSQLGPGSTIPESARSPVEAALGTSFADVRLHDDRRGHTVASAASAPAMSVGRHVVFASGEYKPGTLEGDLMLAHELAHAAQSPGGDQELAAAAEDAELERNADLVALAVAMGSSATIKRGRGLRLQRCGGGTKKEDKDAGPAPVPAPPPKCTKPPITVSRTGHMRFLGSVVESVQPTDVAAELACEPFELRSAHVDGATTYPAGTEVLPKVWDNASPTVRVMIDGTTTEFDVPKWNLRPKRTAAPGVAKYDTNLDTTTKKLVAKQDELDDWIKRKDSYKKNAAFWVTQRDELTKQRDAYAKVVNELQIQHTMYNRFDSAIATLVAKANTDRGLTGKDALDPNIVKAMIFHETEMGTSGPFLADTDPGTNFIMNHYNITQAIDSFGLIYAQYFLQKDPARTAAFGLKDIIKDLRKAQARKAELDGMTSRTAGEDAELAVLNHKAQKSWDVFLREYPGLRDAMDDLWKPAVPGGTPLNQTYEHWIEMMIFELFEKKKRATDWPEAVMRYNGGGKNARAYRDEVIKRAKNAANAERAKKPYIPGRD